jgi:hypothetical protein
MQPLIARRLKPRYIGDVKLGQLKKVELEQVRQRALRVLAPLLLASIRDVNSARPRDRCHAELAGLGCGGDRGVLLVAG